MGEDFFNMDNILSGDEVASLFADEPDNKNDKTDVDNPQKEDNKDESDNDIAEIKSSEELFGDFLSESVGDGENDKGGEDSKSAKDGNSPDKPNFYSSITDALVDDGIFPDLDQERINKVKTPEDFRNLIEERIQSELDERLKRIDLALNAGINIDEVKQYENTLSFLASISPEAISEEGDRGEDLRKRILMQDFMNKNFSQANAVKMIKVLIDSGEDIEQAKQALEENKKFFSSKYQQLLDNAKAAEENEKQRQSKQVEDLKASILNSEKIFGNFEVDKDIRKKAYDNITKPVYKDKNTGEYLTAIQKYRMENESDFIKNVSLLFTLTDGFKDLGRIINPQAKKEVKKKMKELESVLNNSVRDKGGSMKYVGSEDNTTKTGKSFFDMGYTLDV